MIIKSLSRKNNAAQLIKYALRYSARERPMDKEKEQATIIVRHNIRSRGIETIIKEFKDNESYRIYKRKDSVVLYHNIVSFSPQDRQRISDALLKDIAEKFVELRAKDCLCLGVIHKEKAHKHVHLVVSGVKTNGYSARVSKQKFKAIITELEKYQQENYPDLVYSKNRHEGERTKSKEEIIQALQVKRQNIKESLMKHLEKAHSNAISLKQFTDNIKTKDYVPYFRNDKLQGIIVEGRKFRLSRLGFTEEKLEQLPHREHSDTSLLKQLQSIRKQKEQIIQKNVPGKQTMQETDKQNKNMQELQDLAFIRRSSREVVKEDKGIERLIEHERETSDESLTSIMNIDELEMVPDECI